MPSPAETISYLLLQLRPSPTFTVPALLHTSGVALTSCICPQISSQPSYRHPRAGLLALSIPIPLCWGQDHTVSSQHPVMPPAHFPHQLWACRSCIKDTSLRLLPCLIPLQVQSSPSSPPRHGPSFQEAWRTGSSGVGTHHPHAGPTGRESFPERIASKPLQYGQAMLTSWENAFKTLN